MELASNSFIHAIKLFERDLIEATEYRFDLNVNERFNRLQRRIFLFLDQHQPQSDKEKNALIQLEGRINLIYITLNRNTVEDVRETFFNVMFPLYERSRMENVCEITAPEVKIALIRETLTDLLIQSPNFPEEIQLLNHKRLTINDCPLRYTKLILALLDPSHDLSEIAQKVFTMPDFIELFDRLERFHQDTDPPQITEEMVRQTFYDTMLSGMIDRQLISKEALEDQEAYIFFALSAHAIIDILIVSKESSGIKLINNQYVDVQTTPEQFKDFFNKIITIKQGFSLLNELEIEQLRASFIEEEDRHPGVTAVLHTSEFVKVRSVLNDLSITISHAPYFKQIILKVVDFYLQLN